MKHLDKEENGKLRPILFGENFGQLTLTLYRFISTISYYFFFHVFSSLFCILLHRQTLRASFTCIQRMNFFSDRFAAAFFFIYLFIFIFVHRK